MRILVIGLSRDLPLGPADAMELADHLVKRAAGVQSDGAAVRVVLQWRKAPVTARQFKVFFFFFFLSTDLEVLKVERIQLIDAVLNLCTYHHPENIQLPAGY